MPTRSLSERVPVIGVRAAPASPAKRSERSKSRVRVRNMLNGCGHVSIALAKQWVRLHLARWDGPYLVITDHIKLNGWVYWPDKEDGLSNSGAIRIAESEATRREHARQAAGSHTKDEWEAILGRYENRCLRCKIRGEDTNLGRLTKDHVEPLACGGSDWASNLQPLCQRCNSWKGDREIDFRPAGSVVGSRERGSPAGQVVA